MVGNRFRVLLRAIGTWGRPFSKLTRGSMRFLYPYYVTICIQGSEWQSFAYVLSGWSLVLQVHV
jgi:hypothetical protein